MAYAPNYIFVSPLPLDINIESIIEYFHSNYGTVENASLFEEGAHHVAIVMFQQAASAHNALSAQEHIIAGHVVRAPPAKVTETPFSLLDMNDDCLHEILDRLDLTDLCRVASVCRRLDELTKRIFSAKCTDITLPVTDVADAEIVLRTFGPLIKTLRVIPAETFKKTSYNSILQLLVQHCSGTLQSLELRHFELETNQSIILESRPLFEGLLELILCECKISVKWFVGCNLLVRLVLNKCHVTYNGAQFQHCHNLTTLKVIGASNWVAYGMLIFLEQNPQIKTVELLPIETHSSRPRYNTWLQSVPPTLEALTITPTEGTTLRHFKALKRLSIISHGRNAFTETVVHELEFQNLETLEYLHIELINFNLNRASVDAICKLKNLKTLKLKGVTCETAHFLQIVRIVKELSELHLATWYQQPIMNGNHLVDLALAGPNLQRILLSAYTIKPLPDAAAHQKLCDVVSQRTNHLPLEVIIYGPVDELADFNLPHAKHGHVKIECIKTFYGRSDIDAILRARGILPLN